jgi:hypothetical protein
MRARLVSEAFTQDSDPIRDMGIGIEYEIKRWIDKNIEEWLKPSNFNNTTDVLNCLLTSTKDIPHKYIEYLIVNKDNYDESYVLHMYLSYYKDLKKDLVDTLLKKGAIFKYGLADKVRYVTDLKGTLVKLTPTEELKIAFKKGNFKLFKKQIEKGTKLDIGMINSLFDMDYSFHPNLIEKNKIKEYLKEHIDDLEYLVRPGQYKKIDRMRTLLNVQSNKLARNYPQGYRIYRVLKFIGENEPVSRTEISKFIYDLNYGKDSYNPLRNQGYWSDAFPKIIYSRTYQDPNSKYYLNDSGKRRVEYYRKKFENLEKEIDPYI